MIQYATIYYLYTQFWVRVLRWILFIILGLLSALAITQHVFPQIFIFFLSSFLLIETFFHFKICRITPRILAAENTTNIYDSVTLKLLSILLYKSSFSAMFGALLKQRQVQFLLAKSDITAGDLKLFDIPKDKLLKIAADIVKNLKGKYITSIDVMAAYLLITEPQTNLLFSKNLKEEEFMHIVYWTHADFPAEENPIKKRVIFWGEGIGEDWVSGWTYETQKYIIDLTKSVISYPPVLIDRKKEYQEIAAVLSKTVKNSIILVGSPGVGRTTLIKALAYDSYRGVLRGNLYHKRFYQLMIGTLIAGAATAGDLEARLQPILDEVAHAGNLIFYIPELENIVGSSTFHLDLSGAFFPYLKEGAVTMIATITPEAYKTFIESRPSFSDVFDVIHIEEPNEEETISMLLEQAHFIEQRHGVVLTYNAIIAAVDFSKRYNPDHALPGAAISLLSFVASNIVINKKYLVEEKDVVDAVEQQTHIAIAKPTNKEKEALLNIEGKLHERVVDQEEAINAIGEALRRIRSGLTSQTRPISFLFLGPTGVGKTETAKALASIYFGGEDKMIRLDMSEYSSSDSMRRLLGAAPGQGEERGELTEKVREHPFSLVLLDEFEKANPEILNLFLQVLEDGRLTDNRGKTISFINTIIIATSNAGSEFIREELITDHKDFKQFQATLLEELQKKSIFKPELLNRFDEIIAFKPLGDVEVQKITRLLLNDVSRKLSEQDITVTFDDNVIAKIAKEGFDKEFGARPLRRFIDHNIEDLIAQKILRDEIKRGAKINISVDSMGNITIG